MRAIDSTSIGVNSGSIEVIVQKSQIPIGSFLRFAPIVQEFVDLAPSPSA
jgi:hypothetical protein